MQKKLDVYQEYLLGYEEMAVLPGEGLSIKAAEEPQVIQNHEKFMTSARIFDEIGQSEMEVFRYFLNNDLFLKLVNCAEVFGVTMCTLLETIWGIVLQKYNNVDDVVFGVEYVDGIIPLRVKSEDNISFSELLQNVHKGKLILKRVGTLSETVLATLTPLGDNLFGHLVNFSGELPPQQYEDVPMDKEQSETKDLSVEYRQYYVNFKAESLPTINFAFSTKLYSRIFVELTAGHLSWVMQQVFLNPMISLTEIELITFEEKEEIIRVFNDTDREFSSTRLLHEIFEEQVERIPQAIAALYKDEQLTYEELNKRINGLARTLRNKGVGQDTIVALVAERSLEMLIGIYAILKAGGAYLPIEPNYPAGRISYMLEDSQAHLLLTQEKFSSLCEFEGEIINLEDSSLYSTDCSNLQYINSPNNLAYIIYTSGSTGKPKGVMIEHHSVVNRLHWMQSRYPLTPVDCVLQKTQFVFDVSVWELFWWFFAGAKVAFLVAGGEKIPMLIVAAVEKYQITIMHFVPSMLNVFLEYVKDSDEKVQSLRSLRHVFASGEALAPVQVNVFNAVFYNKNGTNLTNLYGPTEATVDVSYYDCSSQTEVKKVPIGKPIQNIHLLVYSKEGRLQPVGVAGELCIGGVGLARGYWQRPELTEKSFIFDSLHFNERIYRTGDLARWLPDGNLEFLGRIDFQVKIRGLRIELGEIESALLNHQDIQNCVVIVKQYSESVILLVSYIVSKVELTKNELKSYLSNFLPSYMIPDVYIRMDSLPVTINGKIDRKALPNPTFA